MKNSLSLSALVAILMSAAELLLCAGAAAQSYQWAKNIGSTGADYGRSIAVDKLKIIIFVSQPIYTYEITYKI